MPKNEIIFIIDPMCSWCWGFAPIIEALRTKHTKGYTFSLLLGGLRQTMPWNAQSKDYLKQNWMAVEEKTSQKFSYALLHQTHFNYNTYLSCKAVLSARELWGEEEAFSYLHSIQKAFYTQAKDITNIEVLSEYILHDKEEFLAFYHSQRSEILLKDDFSKARSMGVNSFPSVIKINREGQMLCLSGYSTLEEIITI